jgi:glycerol-3-phosphate acyltransferase PlsY
MTGLGLLAIVIAYLLGSIPTAVWWGKTFFDTDVRQHGSKNAGATNTFRVLGKKAGFPVLLIDILKGVAAIFIGGLITGFEAGSAELVNMEIACGVFAVIGHLFPIFAGFKGGKGVATTLGVVLSLHPLGAACSLAIFLVVFLATRYVSLGSVMAAFAFPFLVIMVFQTPYNSLMYFSMIFAILIIIKHQKNLQRLINNEENRMKIG